MAGGQLTGTPPDGPLAVFARAGLFGGMSGVNYGLFGYAWVRGRLDPGSSIWVAPNIALYMIGWFVICLFMTNVANGAHAGGLIAGAAMGASKPVWRSLTGR
jgi:GlpG protein